MEKIKNYIGGELVLPLSKKYLNNYSPTNGIAYSLVPDSDESDVDLALLSAKKSFSEWGSSTKEYRYDWMMKLAQAIDDNAEELAVAESFDNGKPEWLARTVDVPRCSANIRFFATAILHFSTSSHDMDGLALNYTLKNPIGVAGCISPWNLPLYLLTWKIAPAIAVGNTVIAKPSEITPYTAYLFSKICREINFPKGVINIVHGSGTAAGAAVVKKCDVISFTGGTETGKLVAANAAKEFKKCSLELGGKNPTVVFSDCDIGLAVETAVKASFLNQGQICLCGSRIFVEESVYELFKEKFLEKTENLIVGDPSSLKSNLGAVVSKNHLEKIILEVQLAERAGGKIIFGGDRLILDGNLSGGYYMSPTVIENTKYTDKINQEEIFGPVVTIMPFKDENEVVKMCNDTKYGLAAVIFSNNISKAHRVAAKIKSGLIWINTWLLRDLRIPFGGMKHSGLGREGGCQSLDFFTETKNVCVKIEKGGNK
jgi:aminomuconate-semialdehyde/2-hydroxymuconate-6-semialdehyde dehydrogenase